MFFEQKTLIVVYKDELVLNQLKKLVETKSDDEKDGENPLHIVAWTEKVWKDQKKAGNISNKVLFLGNIKDTDKLIPVIDVQYSEYGITYGWAGNQLILYADPKELAKAEDYNAFIRKLSEYPLPEILKSDMKPTEKERRQKNEEPEETETPSVQSGEEKPDFRHTVRDVFCKIKKTAASALADVGNSISQTKEKLTTDWNKIQRQQLYYGVMKLYENDLYKYIQNK